MNLSALLAVVGLHLALEVSERCSGGWQGDFAPQEWCLRCLYLKSLGSKIEFILFCFWEEIQSRVSRDRWTMSEVQTKRLIEFRSKGLHVFYTCAKLYEKPGLYKLF